ncbi:hypothetical protein EMPG_12766 [Blastomyces silverae]|uniref:Uncharacterized protein n=1 Tax=Blastomyces silverae TaxID=2060906 RepID=A0A0H1BSJ9_9EURO|nr:hypothetical protein EMPG_12766 [Blastomyces silverae]
MGQTPIIGNKQQLRGLDPTGLGFGRKVKDRPQKPARTAHMHGMQNDDVDLRWWDALSAGTWQPMGVDSANEHSHSALGIMNISALQKPRQQLPGWTIIMRGIRHRQRSPLMSR